MSAESDDCVVLFKAVSEGENEDDDAYSNLFRSSNFQVILIPVLDFEFVNLDKLLVKLQNPDQYEGIIFTSPRCVTAVELSVQNGSVTNLLEKWQKHKHFVVGEKTAQTIQKFNFTSNGKGAGNAKKLAEIMSCGHYMKHFLYPKGSLTKDTFKDSLRENGINVDDVTVYKTKPHGDLETNITKIKYLFSGKTTYFIYFSPSGFIAIGPTTEGALKESGLKVAAIAAKPDPQSLLNAILAYKRTDK